MWYNRHIEKNDSAAVARSRLRYILAFDRVKRRTRRATIADFMFVFSETATLMLPIFAEVKPLPINTGQIIKWRRNVPFQTGELK